MPDIFISTTTAIGDLPKPFFSATTGILQFMIQDVAILDSEIHDPVKEYLIIHSGESQDFESKVSRLFNQ